MTFTEIDSNDKSTVRERFHQFSVHPLILITFNKVCSYKSAIGLYQEIKRKNFDAQLNAYHSHIIKYLYYFSLDLSALRP